MMSPQKEHFYACYIHHSFVTNLGLELDVYNGSGEFFGRMGRDPGRPDSRCSENVNIIMCCL